MHINILKFADDVNIIDEKVNELAGARLMTYDEVKRHCFLINIEKARLMVSRKDMERETESDRMELENAEHCTYFSYTT
jgi:hypothetical protein